MPFLHTSTEAASQGAVKTRCGVTITIEDIMEETGLRIFADRPWDWYFENGMPPKCPDCATLEALDFVPEVCE